LDANLVEALQKDYRSAPITDQERVMLDYVVKMTKDATRCSPRIMRGYARWDLTIAASCRLL